LLFLSQSRVEILKSIYIFTSSNIKNPKA